MKNAEFDQLTADVRDMLLCHYEQLGFEAEVLAIRMRYQITKDNAACIQEIHTLEKLRATAAVRTPNQVDQLHPIDREGAGPE